MRPSNFHRWVCGWAGLVVDLCLIITLGQWWPTISLRAQSWALRSVKRQRVDNAVTRSSDGWLPK